MKNILQVNTSILGEHSVSKSLSDFATDWLRRQYGGAHVTVRDTEGLPHLTGETLAALAAEPVELSREGKALAEVSNRLIAEVREADVIVFGVPMYNFFIPSQLKSYFDFIARAGVTFKYTQNGPVGLLRNRRVYIISAAGGTYQEPGEDLITPYLKKVMGFVGMTDLRFVHAEGLAMERGANKGRIIRQARELVVEAMAGEPITEAVG